jgi:hypothetical protein
MEWRRDTDLRRNGESAKTRISELLHAQRALECGGLTPLFGEISRSREIKRPMGETETAPIRSSSVIFAP